MPLFHRNFRAMGSPCVLHLYASSRGDAEKGFERCRAELERLEAKYTRFRANSLTTRINATAGSQRGIEVDDETASLLDYADTAHRESGGLFDISSGVLRRAWDFRSGKLPTQETVDRWVRCVGWHKIRWKRPHLVLPIEQMQLDFGGIVKEYAADRLAELSRSLGFQHGLIDLGGDLAVVGTHPGGHPWIVGVRDPRDGARAVARIKVFAGGVATSGDYERGMFVDGVRYGHLLDPRTGWPVAGPASVTVLASHCVVAGSAATIAALSGESGARSWLTRVGLPYLGIDQDGRHFEAWHDARAAKAEGQGLVGASGTAASCGSAASSRSIQPRNAAASGR